MHFLLVFLCFCAWTLQLTNGAHHNLCIGIGLGPLDGSNTSESNAKNSIKGGYYSLGVPLFFSYSMFQSFAGKLSNSSVIRPEGKGNLEISVYGIQVRGKWMQNWLRVQIHMNDAGILDRSSKELASFVIFAEDVEGTKAIGEFVHDFPCNIRLGNLAGTATKFMLLPCAGTPTGLPTVPGTVLYTADHVDVNDADFKRTYNYDWENRKFEGIVNPGLFTSFNLFWRFSDFPCSPVTKFRFRAEIILADSIRRNVVEVHSAMSPNITVVSSPAGAADPVPRSPRGVNCTGTDPPSWAEISSPGEIPVTFESVHCRPPVEDDDHTSPAFGGRCSEFDLQPNVDTALVCEKGKNDNVPQKYKTYVKSLPSCSEVCVHVPNCSGDCSKPDLTMSTPDDSHERTTTARTRTKRTTTTSTTEISTLIPPSSTESPSLECIRDECVKGYPVDSLFGIGHLVWNGRVIHGILMTFLSIFVIPVSNLLARYYKETFMRYRVSYCPLWYFVHLKSVFAGLVLLGAGWHSLISKEFLGHSLSGNAWFHRTFGYVAIGLYVLATVTGPFRCMSYYGRMCSIGFHWLIGTGTYVLCLLCMITSVFIPGSPSTAVDTTNTANVKVFLDSTQNVLLLTFCWIFICVGTFLFLGILLCLNDRKMLIDRTYWPTPIPILDDLDIVDYRGATLRKFILVVYIVSAFLLSCLISLFMAMMSTKGRGFGPMSCTHVDSFNIRKTLDKSCSGISNNTITDFLHF